MHILIVNSGTIPVLKYGGTQRVIWYLGQGLVKLGHKVSYLVGEGSSSDFARVLTLDKEQGIGPQIPEDVDIVHFNFVPKGLEDVNKPYLITIHGNNNDYREFDQNTVFVSANHAARYGSNSYVYNGMDWDDYMQPLWDVKRNYFHFLGKAAWRVKNVQGAIDVVLNTRKERLEVLGGVRFNFSMGLRLTFSPRVGFHGMVGGEEKFLLLNASKGLIFPVRWHEPFGLAITESLFYGCPVFGTPYGSLPELVPKEVGFLSNSLEHLSHAIEHSEDYSAKYCHEYARDLFNSRVMTEKYLQKYQEVLEGRTLNEQAPRLIEKQEEKFLDWKG